MANNTDLIEGTLDVADEAAQDFDISIEKVQRQMLSKILAASKDLKTDKNGNVKQTLENNKVVLRMQKAVKDLIETPSYQKTVERFIGSYDKIADINLKWYETVDKDAI